MANVKIKLNSAAFKALRNDKAVKADLLARAKRIQQAAGGEGEGYILRVNYGRENRAGVTVLATGKAHWSNRKHQTLLRSLSAGK
jgi:hypothetical protein